MKYHGLPRSAISGFCLRRFAISEKSSCRVAVLRLGNQQLRGLPACGSIRLFIPAASSGCEMIEDEQENEDEDEANRLTAAP
jgi:hypothetical protein